MNLFDFYFIKEDSVNISLADCKSIYNNKPQINYINTNINDEIKFKRKYLKYKSKYLSLKKLIRI